MAGPSGVIVRGMGEERSPGLVSKGAVKEFPSSLTRHEQMISPMHSPHAPSSLIGINRTQNDSTVGQKKVPFTLFSFVLQPPETCEIFFDLLGRNF